MGEDEYKKRDIIFQVGIVEDKIENSRYFEYANNDMDQIEFRALTHFLKSIVKDFEERLEEKEVEFTEEDNEDE